MRILIYTRNLKEKTRRIGGIVLRERQPFRGLHVNTSALARPRKVGVIGLTGEFGVKMGAACDLCRCVPTKSTPRMQRYILTIGHTICGILEQTFTNV